jgi:cation diffusion facilitator CzcD-associated flavoprotein CzcO
MPADLALDLRGAIGPYAAAAGGWAAETGMRVAVIGCGVCGVAAAKTLKRLGHEVTIYERHGSPGGVWAVAYAGAALQSHRELYAYSDFPWPFETGPLPSAAEICRYLEAAIIHYGLDIRYGHEVTDLAQTDHGWRLGLNTPGSPMTADADLVVVAAGHHTHEKAAIELEGRDRFKGRLLTEHEVTNTAMFDGQRVAVVGMGKSAVDMASFALRHAAQVHHVFREARWLLPRKMLGQDTTRLATERLSNFFTRSWVYPHKLQQLTQRHNPRSTDINDRITSGLVRRALGLRGGRHDAAVRARLKQLDPSYTLGRQFRGTVLPDDYMPAVVSGRIEPHLSGLKGLTETGIVLADGSTVDVDAVVLAIGYKRPALPFLPEPVRGEFEAASDGVQLYRHIVHPALPHLMFAGFNHNPLHLLSSELAALWIDAVETGSLTLPSPGEMEASRLRVRDWKQANMIFEPTRGYWVGAHLHNYLDVLLMELGLKSRRKSNPFSEWLSHYEVADYATLVDEYEKQRGTKRTALLLDT